MLEDYKKDIYKCVKCGACRVAYRQSLPSCPVGEKFGFDSYYAIGKMAIARSLLEGELEWSDKIAQRFYNCALCGTCDAHCYAAMGLRPLKMYIEMRRELVRRGLGPLPGYVPLIDSLKQKDNPYLGSQKGRGKWARKLNAKKADQNTEVLFFVGCSLEFDPTSTFIAEATGSLLNKAKVNWGILGEEEVCCGFPALEVGCEDEFKRLAEENIRRINQLGVKTLVTSCTGCQDAIKREWPRYGQLNCEVMHISEYCALLIKEGRLKITGGFNKKVTLHDPCLLGRYNGVYEEPREVLRAIPGIDLVEMPRNREEAWCCGAGGGLLVTFPEWSAETATGRLEEALSTGAEVMVVPSCPTCNLNFDIALHGYASAVKLYRDLWQKAPVTLKFLSVAERLAAPFLKRRKKVEIDVLDLTQLVDMVTE